MSKLEKSQPTQRLVVGQVKKSVAEQHHYNYNIYNSQNQYCTPTALLGFGATAKRSRHHKADNNDNGNEIENSMTDTATTQKRANFSALSVANANSINKISPNVANAKPGSARKLVIKNFKSKRNYLKVILQMI